MEELGGYRVVRKLGEGARAEVLLGLADDAEGAPVALKVYRPGVTVDAVLVEIEALHRAAGPHVQKLLDVAAAGDGMPVLVLERLTSGGLERELRSRAQFAAGEAITILAPLAEALARLHDAGVLHGAMTARAVLFAADGAPVLSGFGRAALVEPGLSRAAREAEPGFAADLAGFASCARQLLERVPGVDADRVLDGAGDLRGFADRLFSLGEPSPVRFDVSDVPVAIPARLVRGDPVPPPSEGAGPAGVLPAWVGRRLPEAFVSLGERLRTALAAVRPKVWIVAGTAAVALVFGVVLVPSNDDSGAAPAPSASPATTRAPDASPVSGDDPIAAAATLIDARGRCIRELSVLCLDDVDQAGSAALADDQMLIRSLQDGAGLADPLASAPEPIVLVERLGDSAIVSLGAGGEPVSILMMKGEGGWRFRQYLPG